jgi:UDP-3-O-[3-hydroxymyristoyl] glucosamine N-acyltransferase
MGVTLKYLVETLGGQLIGSDIEVERVSSIANAQAGSITFITDSKYQKELIATKASAVILTAKDKIFSDLPSIITDNPYAYFAQVSTILNPKPKTLVGIHKTADVDKATENTSFLCHWPYGCYW